MDNLKQIIGRNIAFYRKKSKLTQIDLAKAIGKNERQEISKIENGLILTRIDTLIDLAQALNVSIDALLGIEPKENYINGKFYKLDSFDKNIINQTIDILYETEIERNSCEN